MMTREGHLVLADFGLSKEEYKAARIVEKAMVLDGVFIHTNTVHQPEKQPSWLK